MQPETISEWIETHPRFRGRELREFIARSARCGPAQARALEKAVSGKLFTQCLPAIFNLELFITENCNLACDYCFVHGKNKLQRMSFQTARRTIDALFTRFNRADKITVLFIGGEPLLEFPLIKKIVRYANEKAAREGIKLNYTMTTNGTLLNQEMLAFFKKHNIYLLLSLDGLPACHDKYRKTPSGAGSFWQTAGKIPLIKQYQPWLGVRVTPMPDTVHGLAEGLKFLRNLGINQFKIGPAEGGVYWSEADLNNYEKQMLETARYLREQKAKRSDIRITFFEKEESRLSGHSDFWGCRAGNTSLTVAPSGKIFPCAKLLGQNDLKGAYQLGSIDKGITYLERRKKLTGFIPPRREKCGRCDMTDNCTGGCYAINYESNGSIFEPCRTQCRILRKALKIQQKGLQILGEYA